MAQGLEWGAHICPVPHHTGEARGSPSHPGPLAPSQASAPYPDSADCLGKGTSVSPGVGGPLRQRAAAGTLSRGAHSSQPHPEQPTAGSCVLDQTPAETQYWSSRYKGHVLLQVRELIDKVRAVFVETLDELSWMDTASKKKAQEKVGGPWSAQIMASHQQRAAPGRSPPHPLRVRTVRLEVAGSGGKCGWRQDWKLTPEMEGEAMASGSRAPSIEVRTYQEPL